MGQAAGRRRSLLLDVEWRGIKRFSPRYRAGIASIEQVAGRLVGRREPAARLRPAEHTGDLDALRLTVWPRSGIAPGFRHKSSIDQHDLAADLSRREYPEADAGYIVSEGRFRCLHKRFLVVTEIRPKFHPPVLRSDRAQFGPLFRIRQADGRSSEPVIDRGDQRFLPAFAFQLPRAESDQHGQGHERGQDWDQETGTKRER